MLYRGAYEWTDEINWWSNDCKSKNFADKLARLSLAVTVYHIWKVRNQIVYQKGRLNDWEIMQNIIRDAKFSVMKWRKVKKKKKWGIKYQLRAGSKHFHDVIC